MADRTTLLTAVNYPTDSLRELVQALVPTAGVALAGDLLVSQHTGTPAMSVDVAAGFVFVAGTQSTVTQGTYPWLNDAVQTKTITASDPTNPRRDLVIAQVGDTGGGYGGAINANSIAVITGTPAGSPVDPSIPSTLSYVLLARVRVSANASSVTNAFIDDLRPRAATLSTVGALAASGVTPTAFTGGTTPAIATGKYLLQFGSTVATTTATGTFTLTYPTAFPTGVVTVMATPGDVAGALGFLQFYPGGSSASQALGVAFTTAGAVVIAVPIRYNWVAIGY